MHIHSRLTFISIPDATTSASPLAEPAVCVDSVPCTSAVLLSRPGKSVVLSMHAF